MEDKTGGAAFPIPNATDMDGYIYAPEARGMTLRDYMAAAALAMSQPDSPEDLAKWAYAVADAMLRERTK